MQLNKSEIIWLAFHENRSREWLINALNDGFQVRHEDGDLKNLDPANLVLVEVKTAKVAEAPKPKVAVVQQQAYVYPQKLDVAPKRRGRKAVPAYRVKKALRAVDAGLTRIEAGAEAGISPSAVNRLVANRKREREITEKLTGKITKKAIVVPRQVQVAESSPNLKFDYVKPYKKVEWFRDSISGEMIYRYQDEKGNVFYE